MEDQFWQCVDDQVFLIIYIGLNGFKLTLCKPNTFLYEDILSIFMDILVFVQSGASKLGDISARFAILVVYSFDSV